MFDCRGLLVFFSSYRYCRLIVFPFQRGAMTPHSMRCPMVPSPGKFTTYFCNLRYCKVPLFTCPQALPSHVINLFSIHSKWRGVSVSSYLTLLRSTYFLIIIIFKPTRFPFKSFSTYPTQFSLTFLNKRNNRKRDPLLHFQAVCRKWYNSMEEQGGTTLIPLFPTRIQGPLTEMGR